jgi:formylglycine-generating enzyme required for sulfatase activity
VNSGLNGMDGDRQPGVRAKPATIALREPLGRRNLAAPAVVGAAGADIVVPGAAADERLRLEFDGDHWVARAARSDGSYGAARELLVGDQLAVGAARLGVEAQGREPPLLQLEVRHLAGNATIAPLEQSRAAEDADGAVDLEIIATALEAGERQPAAQTPAAAPRRRRTGVWLALAAVATLAAVALGVLSQVERTALTLEPSDADVSVDGLFAWATSDAMFAPVGTQVVRATREGYAPLERRYDVVRPEPGAPPPRLVLQLAKLPGRLAIDTGGVAATVTVDGAPAGEVPGEIEVPAGTRTLTLRAPRYLDVVQVVEVQGAGARQELAVTLQPAWGKVAVSASAPAARLIVGDAAPVALPATVDLPGGVHRLRIEAGNARPWETSVLVRAGQTTTVGPIDLGAPDARLSLRSQPAGADVTISGEFRGRTPLVVDLPAGASYDVLVTRAGHRTWQRRVDAAAGARLALDARLEPILVPLTVRGQPADAEVFIDGVSRGRTPLQLEVLAMPQRLEVRKAGLQTFATNVDLTAGLARTIDYALLPEGKPADWRPPSESASSRVGVPLRLVTGGSFSVGSERREAGRRPNESLRRVTLARPFYMATREITNAEFRRFRADHTSGAVLGKSIDLDAQPVSNVSWDDAVAFCNWLSEQDGLPPAYERRDNRWLLRQPVTTGYRLPTEAEWEFVARQAASGARRYGWGDSLPVPAGFANLAGTEVLASLPAALEGYSDEHLVVAPVAKYPAIGGFHDFTGNLSEWVHDYYSSSPSTATATDPLGPESGTRHMIKGSNWRTASFTELRLAWREPADAASDFIGFRVARYAE